VSCSHTAPASLHSTNFRRHRFIRILVIEIFSSILGLFGLIIGLLVASKAKEFGEK